MLLPVCTSPYQVVDHDDVERDVDVDSVMLVPDGSDVVSVILEQRVVKIDDVVRRGARAPTDWKDTKQRK